MTYFIGRCMWDFRRVYLHWARERERIAQVEAALLDPGAFFRLLTALPHHSEPETILFSTSFMGLLDGRPAGRDQYRGASDLRGDQDGEIADRLKSKTGTVRTRRYRFRRVLYQAASERTSCTSMASASSSRLPDECVRLRAAGARWPCWSWRPTWQG
ncbi:hypothetical protein ACPCA8_34350 [Streptomyces capoamus]|uniref:hypothetical protein n=1 Tax=Streptomyces capoamus TaxID=68183 RepID=UPI003C30DC11